MGETDLDDMLEEMSEAEKIAWLHAFNQKLTEKLDRLEQAIDKLRKTVSQIR